MQGFPRDFEADVCDTDAYRLFGNSVAIDVVYYVGLSMMERLKEVGEIENYSKRPKKSDKYNYEI